MDLERCQFGYSVWVSCPPDSGRKMLSYHVKYWKPGIAVVLYPGTVGLRKVSLSELEAQIRGVASRWGYCSAKGARGLNIEYKKIDSALEYEDLLYYIRNSW
jgi:hypothetical protein